jgi:hypothetical protein
MARMNLFGRPRRLWITRGSELALLVVILLLANPAYAWAYVDPGIGSYVFQLTIAAMVAGAYTLRRYFHAVLTFVRSHTRRERSDRDDDAPQV